MPVNDGELGVGVVGKVAIGMGVVKKCEDGESAVVCGVNPGIVAGEVWNADIHPSTGFADAVNLLKEFEWPFDVFEDVSTVNFGVLVVGKRPRCLVQVVDDIGVGGRVDVDTKGVGDLVPAAAEVDRVIFRVFL
ncbi:MAG: hypothetical protein SV186_03535 [Candidatus Nanohaloarchaea archaeon]|nr:hypothetical protein [Candidatus Nanohaloarchaea archaeon]